MTPFIIYGRKATKLGKIQVTDAVCAHCMTDAPKDVVVFGKYAHIYWIPLFPMGKAVVSECSHCLYTIEEGAFPPDLKKGYEEKKSLLKTPFWHWIGLILIGLLLILL